MNSATLRRISDALCHCDSAWPDYSAFYRRTAGRKRPALRRPETTRPPNHRAGHGGRSAGWRTRTESLLPVSR